LFPSYVSRRWTNQETWWNMVSASIFLICQGYEFFCFWCYALKWIYIFKIVKHTLISKELDWVPNYHPVEPIWPRSSVGRALD
jgi:hypothetical protein